MACRTTFCSQQDTACNSGSQAPVGSQHLTGGLKHGLPTDALARDAGHAELPSRGATGQTANHRAGDAVPSPQAGLALLAKHTEFLFHSTAGPGAVIQQDEPQPNRR